MKQKRLRYRCFSIQDTNWAVDEECKLLLLCKNGMCNMCLALVMVYEEPFFSE